ncbi:cytochrome C assembly family protein [Bibersteinia trehalosi]|uniref:cytochrome C assembly family protein n=1 Tax=Bibersteinia trehalosi TaxID=47735 RepID=UPI004045BFFD
MLFAILTILVYLIALHFGVLAGIAPVHKHIEKSKVSSRFNLNMVVIAGSLAALLHLVDLSHLFIAQNGQNFTLANVASLISVIMSLLATIALPRWKTIWFPVSIIYALGIVTVAVSSFVEGSVIKQLTEDKGLLFHLAMALFSYALFFIALLYAFQLKWLDRKLKAKQFSPDLPALMTVSRHFFNLTLVAQILLTLALITGMIYLHNFFANEHIHKAIFSSIAWLVYAILLLGQWKLHWRGNRVLIYSLSGMILLTFAYFASRMV